MPKRAFDILASSFLLIVFSPFFFLIAVLIRLDSKGPVFHRAIRVGKDAKPFAMYKFRTMVYKAALSGPGLTQKGDSRITRVGRLLREFKIDEVPQLINVLKGEMSIVGPRPEDPRYVVHYTLEQHRVLSVRPGMASPATVKYRREEELLAALGGSIELTYLTVILPDKLRKDIEYICRQSLLADLLVLVRVGMSLFSRGQAERPQLSSSASKFREGGGAGKASDGGEDRAILRTAGLPSEEDRL